MSYTLSDLLVDALIELGQLNAGEATGGSNAIIYDSTKNGTGRDNSWRGGTVFIWETTDGLAPQGEFARISSSTAATFSLSFPALSAAVDAGDKYGFAGVEYTKAQLVMMANKALKKWGDLDQVDTTLSTSSSVAGYDASAEWDRPYGPSRVDVARTATAYDEGWIEVFDWYFEPGVAGSTGKIYFKTYPYSGQAIRVWYHAPHPRVTTFDDVIDGRIQPEAIVQALVTEALDYNNTKIRGGDKFLIQRQNKAEEDYFTAKMNAPRTRKSKPAVDNHCL